MGAFIEGTCTRCFCVFEAYAEQHQMPDECPTCVKLGDRSLLWVQRAMREAVTLKERSAVLRRFRAALGRSWTERDIRDFLSRRKVRDLPPGIIQRERERRL